MLKDCNDGSSRLLANCQFKEFQAHEADLIRHGRLGLQRIQ